MINTPLTQEFVLGAAELENTERGVRPHRLPASIRERYADGQLALMEAQPSGVRIAFTTTAHSITLEVHATRVAYRGAKRARGVLDTFIDGSEYSSTILTDGDVIELDMNSGESTFTSGNTDVLELQELPDVEKTVEIWLPHNEQIELIGLRTDASIKQLASSEPLWVHHGSSISHGSNATHPTGIWPVVAARLGGARLQNLGFGGSALVDSFMARVIRDTPADIISVKLGINVVNLDAMRLRSFIPAIHGFIDTIRDGHPDTPLIIISPLFCGIHEDTPGPGTFDTASLGTDSVQFIATGTKGDTASGKLTLRVIRDALEQVVSSRSDDPNLHYIDGLRLYGENDAIALPLPDGLHPGTEGHELIGRRFAEIAFGEGGPFADSVRQ